MEYTVDIKNVYKFRGYLKHLYLHDTYFGNLDDEIAEVRNNIHVESLNISISDSFIKIVLDNNCTRKDIDEVKNIVFNAIRNFVISNINNCNVPEGEKKDFERFLNFSQLLCDFSMIVNTLLFTL